MKFTHTPESRPLDGYTIKRPIHRGGFGEVYFAVTDGGRDVALKLLRENVEVELRGVQQCLNLSHPNLVTIFDVKQDGDGDYWIVMEFVPGDTLDDALRRENRPLPMEEVLRWMRGLCGGVSFLHERGIVHRDLKPSNIFSAEGVVKVGDVGLSKFITASRRSAHTESVGTVYYMAPEISRGRYGKEVDIYALGVIAFEMATGQIPFDGESAGEILMKHLTQPPNLAILPERLRPVISKALAKDPAQRQRSAMEFLREFEAAVVGRQPVGTPRAEVAANPLRPMSTLADPVPQTFGDRLNQNLGLVIALVVTAAMGMAVPVAVIAILLIASILKNEHRHYHQQKPEYVDLPEVPPHRPVVSPQLGKTMPKSDHWNLPWYGHWVVLAVFGSGFLFAARSGNVPLGGLLVLGGISLVGTALAVKTWKFGYEAISMMFGSNGPTLPQTPIRPVVMSAPSIPVRTSSERLGSMITSWFFAPLSVSALTGAISLVRPDLLHLHQGLSVAALFVSVATVANWAITLVSTMAEDQKWDNWTRRLMFGAGGVGTGGIAYALWNGLFQPGRDLFTSAGQDTMFANFGSHPLTLNNGTPTLAGFMCFFGFWLALVNWLKQTDRLRPSRLSMGSSLWSVIVAGLTTLVFAFPLEIALLWAVVVSASVQLTSPGLVPTRKV